MNYVNADITLRFVMAEIKSDIFETRRFSIEPKKTVKSLHEPCKQFLRIIKVMAVTK